MRKSGGMSGGMKAGGMLKGMSNKATKSSDKSTALKMTPTVNEGADRASTAPTPRTLGPRTA